MKYAKVCKDSSKTLQYNAEQYQTFQQLSAENLLSAISIENALKSRNQLDMPHIIGRWCANRF